MAGGEKGASGETILRPLPLVVADEPPATRPRFRFVVPRIVDYLIVATVMYFLL